MLNKISYVCLLLLLMTAHRANAQLRINGLLGGGYSIYAEDASLYDYWRWDINTGLRADYQLEGPLSVSSTLSYHYLLFDGFRQYSYSSDIVTKSHGTGSHMVDLGAFLRVHMSMSQRIIPYILFGGGHQWIDYGVIYLTWVGLNGPPYETVWKKKSESGWYYGGGLGIDIEVISNIFLSTEVRVFNKLEFKYEARNEIDWLVGSTINYTIL